MHRKGNDNPLKVVATKTPKAVEGYELARFTSKQGDYITNAGLDTHISPFTGEEVAASAGEKVAIQLKEADCIGIQCTCSAINAMETAQVIALKVDHINCVLCGSDLEFDLQSLSEADEDEEEVEDFEDESDDDYEDEDESESEYDDEDESESDEEEDEEEDEDYLGGDDLGEDESDDEDDDDEDEEEEISLEDIKLTDVVPVVSEVSFVEIEENRYGAFVGDIMVATAFDEENNFNHVTSSAFAEGINTLAKTNGLSEALESANFKPVTIKVDAAIAHFAEKSNNRITSSANSLAEKRVKQLNKCLDIAAAGGTVGMFKKEGLTVLVDKMAETLSNLNVQNPRKTAEATLAGCAAQYNKGLLKVALELAKRDDNSLSLLEEQIADMNPIDPADVGEDGVDKEHETESFDSSNPETDAPVHSVESRLNKPFTKTQEHASSPKVTGLFNVA